MSFTYLFCLIFLAGCSQKVEQDALKTFDDVEDVVDDIKEDASDMKAL